MDQPIKVLIVDDNKNFCELLSQYLSMRSEFTVVGVGHDGLQALVLIDELQPDVVVLDIIMPHLDGIGVLDNLRQRGRVSLLPKTIMLTALGLEAMTQKVLELGVGYYMLKPFSLDSLAQRILQLVSHNSPESAALEPRHTHERSVTLKVSDFLHQLGVPANIKGYVYLREAIILVINERKLLGAITKTLYPLIAAQYNSTPSRVERAMRHAIDLVWTRGNVRALDDLCGFALSARPNKPPNGELIALIADKLRLDH